MTYFEEYYSKCKSGEIIIGCELMQQLDMINDDLTSGRYIYETKYAHFRINFMQKFCKQSKNPFYNKPIQLILWQKALIEVIYSVKNPDTHLRRYKKVILLVARKNGKSTLCAADAFTELMCGNGGEDIVCSSNDDGQASIIFDEINSMRELFDPKGKRTHKNQRFIINKRNRSKIFKLSDRTKNKEGRNIDYGILDESHEMKTNIIAKSIEQSQSTKDEPIFINITTEWFVNDGYLDQELIYARQILNGEKNDNTILVWLYTQDSEQEVWQFPETYYKSNPSLNVVKKMSYLIDQLNKAKSSKPDRMFVLSKDFNIKQNNSQAWLVEDEYTNTATFDIEDFRGFYYLGGVDLAETTDLCVAKAAFMRKGDNTKFIIQKYFIPESKLIDSDDEMDYREMARLGYLDISAGNEVELEKVAEWYYSLYKDYQLRPFKIGYDNRFAKIWLAKMDEYGWSAGFTDKDTCERIDQSKEAMSGPMKLVDADIRMKYINNNNHPIDKWCYKNCSIKIDDRGYCQPVKVAGLAKNRIDGAVADIILYAVLMRYRTEFLRLLK